MTREFRRTFFVIVGDVFFYFIIRCACDVCICVCMHVLGVHVCMCDRVHNVHAYAHSCACFNDDCREYFVMVL